MFSLSLSLFQSLFVSCLLLRSILSFFVIFPPSLLGFIIIFFSFFGHPLSLGAHLMRFYVQLYVWCRIQISGHALFPPPGLMVIQFSNFFISIFLSLFTLLLSFMVVSPLIIFFPMPLNKYLKKN